MAGKKKYIRRGNTNVFMVFFAFVFIVVTVVTVEWYRIYTVKEYVDTEMSRALNIAVDSAMLDEYRMEHISKINTVAAKNEFRDYLADEMKLNGSFERYNNGKFEYKLIIQNETLTETPAKYEASGIIRIRPFLVRMLPDIDIPFKQTSRNQRYE